MGNREIGGGRYETPGSQEDSIAKDLPEFTKIEADLPAKIEKKDIHAHAIQPDETEIVVQRHGDYVRDKNESSAGSLTAEAAEDIGAIAKNYFTSLFEQVPEGERESVDVLFVASDTQYFEKGRRSMETGNLALEAAKKVFTETSIPLENIHNQRGKLKGIEERSGSRPMPSMREPQFLDQNPEYAGMLLEKYSKTEGPDGKKKLDINFWIAFETDIEEELRMQHGAEGPDDIADRMAKSINILARYAQIYHQLNPRRRLIIWASTHYDTISPYVRRDVFRQPNYKDEALGVELGGGMTIDIDRESRATTELNGVQWEVPIRTSGLNSAEQDK